MKRLSFTILLSTLTVALLISGCAPVELDEPVSQSDRIKVDQTQSSAQESNSKSLLATDSDLSVLQKRVDLAIESVRNRDLYTSNAFWTIFHGLLSFCPGLSIVDRNTGDQFNALDYILIGSDEQKRTIRGLGFFPNQYGLEVQMGPQFEGQGHQDQFVAILAQWHTPIDQPVHVYTKQYTVKHFVDHVKANAQIGDELSWTIIVIGYYDSLQSEWTNKFGDKLKYEDLLKAELEDTIDLAACGGTHRLYGLTYAYNLHKSRDGKIEGVWKQVEEKIQKHIDLAKQYQNPNGAFSSDYFRGQATNPDLKEAINSCGHTLEWLSVALTDEQLKEPWVQKGVHALSEMFMEIQDQPMESGALYHAAHALLIYYSKVYGFEELSSVKQDLVADANSKDNSEPAPNQNQIVEEPTPEGDDN